MANKKNGNGKSGDIEQLDLFPHNPEIKALGLTKFKLDGSVIVGEMQAVTEANDIAMLTPERWAEAGAAWVVKLFGGNFHKIYAAIDKAHSEYWQEIEARQKDEAIGYARTSSQPAADRTDQPEPESNELMAEVAAVHEALEKAGIQVSAETVSSWTVQEIAAVREWIEAALAAKETGQELVFPMPACLLPKADEENTSGTAKIEAPENDSRVAPEEKTAEIESEAASLKDAA